MLMTWKMYPRGAREPLAIGDVVVYGADGAEIPVEWSVSHMCETIKIRADVDVDTPATVGIRRTDGHTISPIGDRADIVLTVPEPGVALALLFGLAALALLRRVKGR